ncbi:DUF7551 domain-containing protein [Haloparvum sedimenti]|uniref:DUF7551 domain-containing protein n=1 Tax=Haloparvum sedimenti TaxID=1678448 RepID=UPI00071E8366|nr:hypothetical protein [Haloparvum sedimenti]
MIGATLDDVRGHIESLATADGEYVLRCARTGDRPVPTTGLRFPSRPTARAAAKATEQYRAALRRYDPQVPFHDVVACQRRLQGHRGREATGDDERDRSRPESGSRPSTAERRTLVDFCHTAAGATFEAIENSPHRGVETAIMDAYLEAAESVSDPDELCLHLLEHVAREVDDRLDPTEQAALLCDAAARLPAPSTAAADPLKGALCDLRSVAFLEAFAVHAPESDPTVDPETTANRRSRSVTLRGYASADDGGDALVTLPFTLALLSRVGDADAAANVSVTAATRLDPADGRSPAWRIAVATEPTTDRARRGLARVSPGSAVTSGSE